MKAKVLVFVLAVSVAAFAQGRGHGGTMPSQAGGMGSQGSTGSHGSMSGDHGPGMGSANAGTHATSMGKQSPQTILDRNTKLTANLQKLLPAGTTPQTACAGFKNLGQCVAAIHVSNNLGIPFDDLKAKMTGDAPESLGKSITELKPDANSTAEVKKANKQAKQDLTESEPKS